MKRPRCEHYWVPAKVDAAREPLYECHTPRWPLDTTLATCPRCGESEYFTREEWRAIPARLPPPELSP